MVNAPRSGRPHNLHRLAARVVRQHGPGWIADLERQAALGDVAAIAALLELARPARGRADPRGSYPPEHAA